MQDRKTQRRMVRAQGSGEERDRPILEVEDLGTSFFTHRGELRAVNGISFEVRSGEILGVVGESGSGKTLTALSVMRLIDPPGRIISGRVRLDGEDLMGKSERQMAAVRGGSMAMIWQDPMASLNPVRRIGDQIAETIRLHPRRGGGRRRPTRSDVTQQMLEGLRTVNVPDPERRLREYPHQLSGGLQQRIMIAMALASEPGLLIADEPTTALDVTIQLQILQLIKRLQAERGMSVMFITHDLGVVAELCHRVQVMYAGQIVESAPAEEIFETPRHPYTAALLQSVPRRETQRGELLTIPGQVPDMISPPSGCPFHPRCSKAMDVCRSVDPAVTRLGKDAVVRCHLHG